MSEELKSAIDPGLMRYPMRTAEHKRQRQMLGPYAYVLRRWAAEQILVAIQERELSVTTAALKVRCSRTQLASILAIATDPFARVGAAVAVREEFIPQDTEAFVAEGVAVLVEIYGDTTMGAYGKAADATPW